MSIVSSELRQAFRRWASRPAVALTAVVTLALGIGTATAISSAVDGVLLRLGASMLLMLIACANVAGLLLGETGSRRGANHPGPLRTGGRGRDGEGLGGVPARPGSSAAAVLNH